MARRILIHLSTPGGMTGAPRRTLHLCESLRDRGLVVGVIGDPADEFYAEAARRRFEMLPLPRPGVLSTRNKAVLRGGPLLALRALGDLLRLNARLVKLIRSWRPDVLWTRGAKGIAFIGPAAAVTRRPLIWDVAQEMPSRGLVKVLHRAGFTLASAVVFQYAAAARRIFGPAVAARYAPKIHALLPSIETGVLRQYRGTREAGPEGPLVLLQVGTISGRKNQQFSIECLAELRRAGADAELWLAGGVYEARYGDETRALAERLQVAASVKFLGWRGDVHELMLQSGIFILPSHDEGVPNAVQEAMFLGLPVVASQAGGLPEILENGVTGWSLPLDRSAWTAVLGPLIADPGLRRRVGDAAATHAATAFGESAWPDRYAALIETVAGSRARTR